MNAAAEPEEPLALTIDPRWELTQRIVASPTFTKSERQSSLLLFVCKHSLLGQNHKLNEQSIGRAVFGRKANYETALDGIVRTHATRLRQRLEQYFEEYGENETIVVEMPPGSYVPVFTTRSRSEPTNAASTDLGPPPDNGMLSGVAGEPATEPVVRWRKGIWLRRFVLIAALAWMVLSIGYLATHPRLATEFGAEWRGAHHPLWTQVFNRSTDTAVVTGDIALTNFEAQTGRSVFLGEYARNNYIDQYMAQLALQSYSPSSDPFLTKAMTVVDSQFIEKLIRLPGINLDRTKFISARDIQLSNLQSENIVLLGNFRINPWVQAFEPKMNFYFADSNSDLTNSVLMNRTPSKDEPTSYRSTDVAHLHTEYSVIAFQPNLNGSGSALLLEGQSQMSTEAAANFVQNDADLIPFLTKIRRKDGSVPHFEVLLKVKGMSGNFASYEMLTHRLEDY